MAKATRMLICDDCEKVVSPLKKVMLSSTAGKKKVKTFWLCTSCRTDRTDAA